MNVLLVPLNGTPAPLAPQARGCNCSWLLSAKKLQLQHAWEVSRGEIKGPPGLQPGDGREFLKNITWDLENRCELEVQKKTPNKQPKPHPKKTKPKTTQKNATTIFLSVQENSLLTLIWQ